MPELPTPILRALEGLTERTGRTVVITGPPLSGKSKLLESVRQSLVPLGARVVELRGSYHGRSVPFSALDGLRGSPVGPVPSVSPPGEVEGDLEAPSEGPMAPIAYNPERLPRRRRSRGERPRMTFLGQPVRGRSSNEGDPEGYWREIRPEFQGDNAHPLAILIEDGALFDSESRDFVATLSARARLRALLIVLTLDSSVAGASLWEERLFGRGDVDWVRTHTVTPDPREVRRLTEIFEQLPEVSKRITGYLSLLGGNVGEVVLSRVARMNFNQLADALAPASAVGLVRAQEGRVTIPQSSWIPLVQELIAEPARGRMHLEIAEALSALSPEPNLARRVEVAHHYLAAGPGPLAMASLLEAAEISVRLLSYDSATDLLASAVTCLNSLPPNDRRQIEPEVRLLYARSLFFAGRPSEAEAQFREGINGAIVAELPVSVVAELVEPLLLTMRVVGPRPSLLTTLVDLAERCHDARLTEIEVLFEVLLAEFHRERGQSVRARAEAHRAAVLARKLPERHLQALGLLTMGLARIEGDPTDQELAERFLQAARVLLVESRRWELDHLAGDLEARLLEEQDERVRSRSIRERSLAGLQRANLLSIELYHLLGIARSHLDLAAEKGLDERMARAATIVETLHLLPPSPGLLSFWMVQGRRLAIKGDTSGARERWSAIVDLPTALSLPRLRVEAMVRLALLEYATGGAAEGQALAQTLWEREVLASLPAGWSTWVGQLESLASASRNGGGRLPPKLEAATPPRAQANAKSPGARP